jgi:hypothetical protein
VNACAVNRAVSSISVTEIDVRPKPMMLIFPPAKLQPNIGSWSTYTSGKDDIVARPSAAASARIAYSAAYASRAALVVGRDAEHERELLDREQVQRREDRVMQALHVRLWGALERLVDGAGHARPRAEPAHRVRLGQHPTVKAKPAANLHLKLEPERERRRLRARR